MMMELMKQARLTLVGAGPGDPELLTVKAVKALEAADVVLYDALVNPELLKYAPAAVQLFVGKRKGCHAYAQEQINEIIVEYAQKYGHVVRLKGGDPFVFGRGKEEAEYASSQNIPVTVIPGITSAISVPAALGIPVTQRKIAESFWVITGTTSGHELSRDVMQAAKSSATVIILMGMGKLDEIVEVFRREGKEKLPVAIIQNGTTASERWGVGTVETIELVVERNRLSSPAIIILGEVVRAGNYMEKALAASKGSPAPAEAEIINRERHSAGI